MAFKALFEVSLETLRIKNRPVKRGTYSRETPQYRDHVLGKFIDQLSSIFRYRRRRVQILGQSRGNLGQKLVTNLPLIDENYFHLGDERLERSEYILVVHLCAYIVSSIDT